jgi:hypothetical protein
MKEFLALGRSAHNHYIQKLEHKKAAVAKKKVEQGTEAAEKAEWVKVQRELLEETKFLKARETDLDKAESLQTADVDVGTRLLKKASSKLKDALKHYDLK